ncbi:rhomboid-related protein 4 isoform X2 [Hoplias malabaricus]|uniref:rhomboid-related protein 4 isoform X2 n=1 Tax=Hoplias malabaricus TaxID=27720 RepID=UPI003462F3EC
MRNRQRGFSLGLLLLASQVFQLGIENIPPVTLATLGLNVYLFLFPAKPLLQGIKLERRLGGAWFAYLLSVFSLLTGVVYLLLEAGLSELMEDPSFSMQCAVGFSGVIFGLKVVNNYYNPGGVQYIMGIPVANRYACWVELILIHIMNPGTSFVGHLAGILVGLLYTTGPLKTLMETCAGFVNSNGNYGRSHSYYNSSGYSGYGSPYPPQSSSYHGYRPHNNTHESTAPPQHPYTAGLSEEEQYEAAVRASLHDHRGSAQTRPPYGFNINSDPILEELRQRRLQRFDS